MLQMRFCNIDTKQTFMVFEVDGKNLSSYRPKNKYGFINFPADEMRQKD